MIDYEVYSNSICISVQSIVRRDESRNYGSNEPDLRAEKGAGRGEFCREII